MVMVLLGQYFGEVARDRVFKHYNFDINLITKYAERNSETRARHQKKLYRKNIKNKAKKNNVDVIDSNEDIAIYLSDYFDVMGLSAIHSILSNYKAYDVYFVADKKTTVYAKGGGFYIRATHCTDDVKNLDKLIIPGSIIIRANKIDDNIKLLRLAKISNNSNKIIALKGSEKIISKINLVSQTPINDKTIVFESIGSELDWIKNNLVKLTNEFQAELLKSEYY